MPIWAGWTLGALVVVGYAATKIAAVPSRRRQGLRRRARRRVGRQDRGRCAAIVGARAVPARPEPRAEHQAADPERRTASSSRCSRRRSKACPWVVPVLLVLFVVVHVAARPHPLRPAPVRRRRQRGGRPPRRYPGRPHPHLGLRVLRLHGRHRRHHDRLERHLGRARTTTAATRCCSRSARPSSAARACSAASGRMIDAIIGGAVVEVIYNGTANLINTSNTACRTRCSTSPPASRCCSPPPSTPCPGAAPVPRVWPEACGPRKVHRHARRPRGPSRRDPPAQPGAGARPHPPRRRADPGRADPAARGQPLDRRRAGCRPHPARPGGGARARRRGRGGPAVARRRPALRRPVRGRRRHRRRPGDDRRGRHRRRDPGPRGRGHPPDQQPRSRVRADRRRDPPAARGRLPVVVAGRHRGQRAGHRRPAHRARRGRPEPRLARRAARRDAGRARARTACRCWSATTPTSPCSPSTAAATRATATTSSTSSAGSVSAPASSSGGAQLRGHDGHAGEIGHDVVDLSGPPCHCGKHGCVETYVGDGALLAGAGRSGRTDGRGGGRGVHRVRAPATRPPSAACAMSPRRWAGPWPPWSTRSTPNASCSVGRCRCCSTRPGPRSRNRSSAFALEAQGRTVQVLQPSLGADSALVGAAEIAFTPLLNDPLLAGTQLAG